MLRLSNNLIKLTKDALNANYYNLQTVRWRRKPRWVPTAKSKVFKVPARPIIPEEEAQELKRLFNNYRTQIKSIRRYLTYKHCTRFLQKSDTELQEKAFEEDFARCYQLNEEWNVKCEVVRAKRLEEDLQKDIEKAKNRLEQRAEIDLQKLEAAEDLVRKEKEHAEHFVTPENIDAAIEHALANPVDYNYSIDATGNIYSGRDAAADVKKEKAILKQ